MNILIKMNIYRSLLLLPILFISTQLSAQKILWKEDFSGINQPLIDTVEWEGILNLPNNGSLRNAYLIASDNALDADFPAVHKRADGFYSGGGAAYTSIPSTNEY